MQNLFAILGFDETLSLTPEQIDEVWQTKAKETPSADSPAEGDGSEIHLARRVLTDPVSRLEHWLALREIPLERGASMESDLMDLFSGIHGALEKADSVIKRHRASSTALAKALLSKEAIAAQLAVQSCLGDVTARKAERIARFDGIEKAAAGGDYGEAAATLGQLKFLKKWEQQCQERLLELIQC